MATVERAEMAAPRRWPGDIVCVILGALLLVMVVIPATLLALYHLVTFGRALLGFYPCDSKQLFGLSALAVVSCVWLAMVRYASKAICKFHGGGRQFLINHLGVFANKQLLEIAPQDAGSVEFRYGYELFGRRLCYYRMPLDAIVKVEWQPVCSDATWRVFLSIVQSDAVTNQRTYDLYDIGPGSAKPTTDLFGRALVDFLSRAGVALTPGEDDHTYVDPLFDATTPIKSQRLTLGPDEDCVARGAKYSCQIARRGSSHSGVVLDEQGEIRWRYGVRKTPSGRRSWKPFTKKDFVVTDAQTQQEIIFRRLSRFPPRFQILDAQGERGIVRMTSILRNKYTISLKDRQPWTFRMPLFTIKFWGGAGNSPEFWVMIGPSKMEWNILIKPGIDDQPLAAALSFIHVQWWNYS
jgi:hypothetical protein